MIDEGLEKVRHRQEELNSILLGEDDLGVIVRASIMVEAELMDIISTMMPKKTELKKIEKFDFDKKKILAISLGMNKDLEGPIQQIQKIRNRFAHEISSSFTKADADNLYSSLGEFDKRVLNQTYRTAAEKLGNPGRLKEFRQTNIKEQVTLMLSTIWTAVAVSALKAREANAE